MKKELAQQLASLGAVGGEFILIELGPDEHKPLYDGAGQLLRFGNGGDAAKAAAKLCVGGKKIQPRRISDDSWRERELKRLKEGTYTLLPWHGEAWWLEVSAKFHDHFPHVSVSKGASISYTESPEKGSADIQTNLRPGRYLEKYYSEVLNKYVVRDLATLFSSKFEDNMLMIATDEEEIEEVYLTGPTSCMSKETGSYATRGVHPVRAYAGGDLAVAYLRRGGKIAARTVVWPDKKHYNVVYGDKARLEPLLAKQGYKPGTMLGAKLRRLIKYVEDDTDNRWGRRYQFIVPHVDGTSHVQDKGGYLAISNGGKGSVKVSAGAGVTEATGYCCVRCKELIDTYNEQYSMVIVDDSEVQAPMCKKCYTTEKVVVCEFSGNKVVRSICIELDYPHKSWIMSRYKSRVVRCDVSKKTMLAKNGVQVRETVYWTKDVWKENGGIACYACGGGMVKKDHEAKNTCFRCSGQSTAAVNVYTASGTGSVSLGGLGMYSSLFGGGR